MFDNDKGSYKRGQINDYEKSKIEKGYSEMR